MPSESERADVSRQAALHAQRLILLRRTAHATQTERLVRDQGPGGLDEGGDESPATLANVSSQARPGICVSALPEALTFAPHSRVFLVPMSDEVVQLFTVHESRLRKLVRLTKCSIELKRCAVLRRCKGGRWVKNAKIVIRGPTMQGISIVDEHLSRQFEFYRLRRQMSDPAPGRVCIMFVPEGLPDNASLSLGNQRTGGIRSAYGALPLPGRSGPPTPGSGLRARRGSQETSDLGFADAAAFLHPRCPAGRSASHY